MSEPTASAAAPAADPSATDGGADVEKDVIGADGKKISKTALKKQAKMEELAKKKAEKHKKLEEEKVRPATRSTHRR